MIFCNKYCAIAFILLVSKIYMLFSCNKFHLMKDFMNKLDKNELNTYLKIISERRNIYIQGMILGILLGLAYIILVNKKFSNVSLNICIFVTFVFVTNTIYYLLKPKSTYMLNHINEQDKIEAWLDIYRYMQRIYITGILIGIVSYILLSYGLFKC